jgi:hypothetical protein
VCIHLLPPKSIEEGKLEPTRSKETLARQAKMDLNITSMVLKAKLLLTAQRGAHK